MRIVVVSDSHRNTETLNQIYQKEKENTNLFLHCGDSCDFPQNIEPFISVKGNCDFLFDYPNERLLKLSIGSLYIFHGVGGLYQIKTIIRKIKPDVICYGHTHIHSYQMIDGCHVFNPGSVSLPRDATTGTYLVLEGTNKEDLTWHFVAL